MLFRSPAGAAEAASLCSLPCEGREGWGGVPFGSSRSVTTPLQTSPCRRRGRSRASAVRGPQQRRHRPRSPPRSAAGCRPRSEEHTSEHQSLMRISYAGFCLKKKNKTNVKKTQAIQYITKTTNLRKEQ